MNNRAVHNLINALWYSYNTDVKSYNSVLYMPSDAVILVVVPETAHELQEYLSSYWTEDSNVRIVKVGDSLTGMALDVVVLVDVEPTSSYYNNAVLNRAINPSTFSLIVINRSRDDRTTN